MKSQRSDEERRNRRWNIAVSAATVLVVVIGAFLLTKLFTGNPLEGTWKSTDRELALGIRGNGTVIVDWEEIFQDEKLKVEMEYTLDKENKILSLKSSPDALRKASEASGGKYTPEGLQSALKELEASYDYNVEKNKLTLSEREYGEQMVFERK